MPDAADQADPRPIQPLSGDKGGVDVIANMMAARNAAPVPADPLEDEPVAKPAEDEIAEESDQTEDGEQQGDSPDQDTESEPVEADQAGDEDAEDAVIPASIEEFAELAEAPVDELLDTMTIRTQVRGKVQDVPLREIRDGWQKGEDYERRVAEQKNESAADRQREEKRVEQHQQGLAYLGHAANGYQNVLGMLSDDQIDIVRENLGPETARLLSNVRKQLAAAQDNAVGTYNQQLEAYNETAKTNAEVVKNANLQSLLNNHPELSDPKKGAERTGDLERFLLSRGMPKEGIYGLISHVGGDVMVSLLMEAMDGDSVKKQAKVVKRKIKGLSKKQVKPGATTQTPEGRKAKRSKDVADLVQIASRNPQDGNLTRDAGAALVGQYRRSRGA